MPEDIQPPTIEDRIKSHLELGPDVIGQISTEDDVGRVALEIIDSMPEGIILMDRIKKVREKGNEDEQAVRNRNKLWRQVSIEISLITGVEIEAAEHETQKQAYKTNVQIILASVIPENSNDEDIMLRLGIIKPVEGIKGHVFTFPYQILPPFIKEQWDSYIGIVEQFDDAKRKLQAGIISQTDFNANDKMRERAHNTVSQSISEVLEFPDWDLEHYRNFVAKMRDEKLAEPRGEMAVYAELIRDKVYKPEHLTSLRRHLGETAHR